MRITPPLERMGEAEREQALAAFLEFQGRLDARLRELGAPNITEHRQALLVDYARGLAPIVPDCMVLLEMLQALALMNFEDAGFYMTTVCPRVARRMWFEQET